MTGKLNIILFEVRVSVPDPSFCFILAFWPLVQLPSLSLINIVDPSFLMVLKKKNENITFNILIVKYETLVHINFLLKR